MKKLEIKRKVNSLYLLKRIKRIGKMYTEEKEVEEDFNIDNYLYFGKWNEMVEEFDKKFRENFSKEQYYNFKKNIRDVIIRKKRLKKKDLEKDGTRGIYNPRDNSIRVFAGSKEETFYVKERLTHELMHMASRNDENNCGFHHIEMSKEKISLGKSLNEGYTEFLNAAYFTYDYEGHYYTIEKIFASGIEKIVGKEQMRDFYFKGNLLGVIDSLAKYGSPNEAVNLIFDMDRLSIEQDEEKYKKLFEDIKDRISKIQSIKLKMELENDIIDVEEFEKRKFFDIDLYKKYNFIYSDKSKAYIQEYNDGYKVFGDFQSVCLDKKKTTLKFDSDVKILR